MGLIARSLMDLSREQIEQCNYQLLFGSGEEVLNERFLTAIKQPDAPLNRKLATIIIDRVVMRCISHNRLLITHHSKKQIIPERTENSLLA